MTMHIIGSSNISDAPANACQANRVSHIVGSSNISDAPDNSCQADMIPGTDWTYADALEMAIECRTEARLFPRVRHTKRLVLSSAQRYADKAAKFLAETGWTMDAAMEEALEARRDFRLFGAGRFVNA